MSNFDKAFAHVILMETGGDPNGGYTNDPRDPGGETRWGISKHAYPDEDIANLTIDRAKELYKRDYWDVLPMDDLEDRLAFCLFDAAVNCGVVHAVGFLQAACGATVDGVIGPRTIEAIERTKDVTERMVSERISYYTRLSNFAVYGKGWVLRCLDTLGAAG